MLTAISPTASQPPRASFSAVLPQVKDPLVLSLLAAAAAKTPVNDAIMRLSAPPVIKAAKGDQVEAAAPPDLEARVKQYLRRTGQDELIDEVGMARPSQKIVNSLMDSALTLFSEGHLALANFLMLSRALRANSFFADNTTAFARLWRNNSHQVQQEAYAHNFKIVYQ